MKIFLPVLVLVTQASAATLDVTSIANTGAGSLRTVIAAAAGGDTITFSGAAFAPDTVTIALTTPINITKPLIINGVTNSTGENKITITGVAGVFSIYSTTSGVVALRHLNYLACKKALGGAIDTSFYSIASVQISDSVFEFCEATAYGGAITSLSATGFEITNSVFLNNTSGGNAGAVYISGSSAASIQNCNFTENQATGSVAGGGAVEITNTDSFSLGFCAFSGNSATFKGGASSVSNSPGIIQNCTFSSNSSKSGGALSVNNVGIPNEPITLLNCTFSGNQSTQAGSAIDVSFINDFTIQHCTITGNNSISVGGSSLAGAVQLSSNTTVKLANSIVAGNFVDRPSGVKTPDIQAETGTVVSLGRNIIGDVAGSGTVFTSGGDRFGNATTPLDPGVLPLADNGGNRRTHALRPLSPAVDYATTSTTNVDERNLPRPSGGFADSGAFERQVISYTNWAQAALSGYPANQRQRDDDPDGDGISNGLEFVQGTAPQTRNTTTDRLEAFGGSYYYSFTINDTVDFASIPCLIGDSEDLTNWSYRPISSTLNASYVGNSAGQTRYRLPIDTAGRQKYFLRMAVGN